MENKTFIELNHLTDSLTFYFVVLMFYLILLVVPMVDIGRPLGEELPDVAVAVEEAAGRVGTEAGLVRVQRDRVRLVHTTQLKIVFRRLCRVICSVGSMRKTPLFSYR